MVTRDLFWFAAGLLAAIACILVAIPLLRGRQGEARPESRGPLLVAAAAFGAVAVCIVGLYLWLGTPAALDAGSTGAAAPAAATGPAAGATAPSMEEATARLAARLAAGGGTRDEWLLLAQSYDFLGRAGDAAAARAQAEAADDGMAGPPGPPPGAAGSAPPATAAATGARIAGSVDLAPELRDRAGDGATLFIYAKQPGAAGPPLAVLRTTTGSWPVGFTLDDSNAMVPGRNLSGAETVQIEARISKSGNATPQPGDLAGTVPAASPRDGKPVRIVIDRVIG